MSFQEHHTPYKSFQVVQNIPTNLNFPIKVKQEAGKPRTNYSLLLKICGRQLICFCKIPFLRLYMYNDVLPHSIMCDARKSSRNEYIFAYRYHHAKTKEILGHSGEWGECWGVRGGRRHIACSINIFWWISWRPKQWLLFR